MDKKCVSIKTSDFEKSLKEAGPQHARKILEMIERLEIVENDKKLVPDGVRSAHLMFGKHLREINPNIYVLEASRKLRAMALVTENENTKAYVWFWGGQHEKYNEKLKAKTLEKQEANLRVTQGEKIDQAFSQKNNLNKDQINHRVSEMKEKYLSYENKSSDKIYKK